MENQVTDLCLLCYKETAVLEVSDEHIRGLKTINNLFDLLGIPMKFFYELWPVVTPQFEINLTFCPHCESLIDQGLTLKNQLNVVKSDLIENARGGAAKPQKDVRPSVEDKEPATSESRVLRNSFRKLILDGDVGGPPQEINDCAAVTRNALSEDSAAENDDLHPTSPIRNLNEDSLASLDDGNGMHAEPLPLEVQCQEIQPDRSPSPMSLVGFDFFANLNVNRDIFAHIGETAVSSKNIAPATVSSNPLYEKPKRKTRGKQRINKDTTVSYNIPSHLKDGKIPVRRNPKRQKLLVQGIPLDFEDQEDAHEIENIVHAPAPAKQSLRTRRFKAASYFRETYKCPTCWTVCSSQAVLEVHNQEIHAENDDRKLMFKCTVCDGELHANKFFLSENRYSTIVDGAVKCFEYFFQLCDHHFQKCSRAQPIRKLSTQASSTETPSEALIPAAAGASFFTSKKIKTKLRKSISRPRPSESKTEELKRRKRTRGRKPKGHVDDPTQIYLYRRLDPITKCMLCKALCSFSSLPRHYHFSHGLTCCSEDRFSCGDCQEIYTSKVPGTKPGKLAPGDLDHFKEFAIQHSICNRPKQTEFTCEDCKSLPPFSTPKEFFYHNIELHVHDEKFKCALCGERYICLQYLSRHVKHAHHATFKFVCGICPDSFLSINDYHAHLRNTHAKNSVFVCYICDHQEPKKWRYANHMREKHGLKIVHAPPANPLKLTAQQIARVYQDVRPFPATNLHAKCFICERMHHGPELLDLHLRELHEPAADAADLSFKCKCGKEFKKSDYLAQDEDGDPEYKYPTTVNLRGDEEIVNSFSHFCNVHALICPTWTDPRTSPYNCVKCKKNFDSPDDYVLHLQSYYTHLLANCHLCEFGTHDSSKLDPHYYRIHNIKQVQGAEYYYCRFCRTCFDGGRPELETGKLIVEDLEKFKEFAKVHATCKKRELGPAVIYNCKFCGKTIKTKPTHSPMELFKHEVEEHTKNFLRYCEICAAGYFTFTEFNFHRKSHNKRFKCDICSATFRYNQKWEDHMRGHNNDRAYVCHICGKSFWAKSRLREHEQTHIEEKDYPCTICGKMFKTPRNVRSHKYIVHKKRSDAASFLIRRSNISNLKPQQSQTPADTLKTLQSSVSE